ncbi:MAG TPA: xylulokinase [Anaerolineae bacterium]|nr:xylulokinase [Anaerolineae bacterium]
MKNVHLIGVDIGTSGLKCGLIDETGQLRASAFRAYTPDLPRPGWAEQDPDVWLNAALAAVREVIEIGGVDRGSVAGLSFSGQMHSTVFLDRDQRVIRPAILWLDARSTHQVETLHHSIDRSQLAEWIGNPVMPGFMLLSLLWVKEQEPTTWNRLAHVMLAKDYVRLRLTGEIATDFSDASSTALLDVQHRQWCVELLRAVDIPIVLLPPLCSSSDVVGHLLPTMAEVMNLPAGLPVICGAGDQEAQAIGNGIIRSGLLSSTIGTGGQLFTPIDQCRSDPQLRIHTFCHAIPNLWHWQAATLTAGASLRWLRDEILGGHYSYQELADAATSIEPGAEGLLFHPYLAGERTPHMNPNLRGSFTGLSLRHTWQHMTRAVMEGVVFSLFDGLELMRDLGASFDQVIASGGGPKHPLWLQLQADVFGRPVRTTQTPEAAAFGAALLAGVGAGIFVDVPQACARCVQWSEEVYEPRADLTALYRSLIEHWRVAQLRSMT